MSNPYLKVTKLVASRKPSSHLSLIIFVACCLISPLSKPALLHFLDSVHFFDGLQGLSFRLGGGVAGAVSLASYHDIIRSRERDILNPHPIQPKQWIYSLMIGTVSRTWSWPFAALGLALPLLWEGYTVPFAALALVVWSSWFGMIGLSYTIHLGSVWAARTNRLDFVLNALRGENPKEQAAFIYAPGFALFWIGFGIMMSSSVIEGAVQLRPIAVALLFLPVLIGMIALPFAIRLSESQLVPASAVVAEIDARWAVLEKGDEVLSVYLDWLAGDRLEFLRALRHGWRVLRIWPIGAWVIGFFGFVAAWTSDHHTAVVLSAAGALGVCAISAMFAKGDPLWLDDALGVSSKEVGIARFWVSFLYAQGAILPSFVLFLFNDASLLPYLLIEMMVLFCSALSAGLSIQMRERGLWLYSPIALLVWAIIGFLYEH